MKYIYIISVLLLSIGSAFGQKEVNGLTPKQSSANSEIKVFYANHNKLKNNAAISLNNKLVNELVIKHLDPDKIESVNVKKGPFLINNISYNGKIIIKTKDDYQPNLISLNQLKTKHINVKENATIFQIDNKIITADYDTYLVDEKYILNITVKTFKNPKEKLNINIINLMTKSVQNINKANNIILRGNNTKSAQSDN
jgi:hypothetical protein